ncbi:DUF262 domain-containing protein [Acidocella sp.]|uniref:DUF262 domain-containing protein n=1 Tax=Acidocella sp. TaxID=50710 RepID=UPI00262A6624|nr:DUF262 domain-containing protein [Acidocella sp.]
MPEWFSRIESGQLRLPRFQRFEAWGASEVANLLEAMVRELPAGAALILEVGDQEKFISRIMSGAPTPRERVTEHLLDGQQRLTALWKSLNDLYDDRTYLVRFEADPETGNPVPCVDGQARWRKEKDDRLFPLWCNDPTELNQRGYFPIRLVRPNASFKEILDWCGAAAAGDSSVKDALLGKVTEMKEKVTAYNVPYLSLPATTRKEVALDVFIKLNTSSVRLTAFDIVVAEVEEATGQSLHDLINKLHQQAPGIDRYVTPGELLLQVAALREDKPPTQASFQRLDLTKLVDEWNAIAKGISWMVSLLEDEKVFDAARLPTVAILPVLGALHAYMPEALDARGNAKALVKSYLWRSFFTRRYENTASTRAFQDFRGLRDTLRGLKAESAPIFNEVDWPLPTADELFRARWPKTKDILGRAILAAALKAGGRDFADDEAATKDHLANREYHHLFPASLLAGSGGLPEGASYKALNCALVTWRTNRNISAKEPVAYLRERTEGANLGKETVKSRLRSHLIPFETLNAGGWENISDAVVKAERIRSDFDAFLRNRASRLLPVIKTLCNGKDDVLVAWDNSLNACADVLEQVDS